MCNKCNMYHGFITKPKTIFEKILKRGKKKYYCIFCKNIEYVFEYKKGRH